MKRKTLLLVALVLGLGASCSSYLYPGSPAKYAAAATDCLNAADERPLRQLAESTLFRIGAAVHDIQKPGIHQVQVHSISITPAEAPKWSALLKDGKLGTYDFTDKAT